MDFEKIAKALASAKSDDERSKVLADAGYRTEKDFNDAVSRMADSHAKELAELTKTVSDLKGSLTELRRAPIFGDPQADGSRDDGNAGSGKKTGAIMRLVKRTLANGRTESDIVVHRANDEMDEMVSRFKAAVDSRGYASVHGKVGVAPKLEAIERAYSGVTGSAGGFTIGPGDFFNGILEIVYEDSELWNSAQKVALTKDTWSGAQLVQTFGTSPSYYGGITATWGRAQNSALSENTNASYQLRELRARECYIYQIFPRELLDDSPAFLSHAMSLMGRRATYEFDEQFWNGDGILEPLGILVDPNVSAVTRTTASRVKLKDVTNLDDALDEAFPMGSYWGRKASFGDLPNDVTATEEAPKIQIMYQDVSQALNPGLRGSLNGHPVVITKHAPALGSKGDVVLMDPRSYLIGVRQDWVMETSDQALWTSHQFAAKMIARVDGLPIYPAGIKPLAA